MVAIDFPFRVEHGAIATTKDYDRIVCNHVIDVVTTNERERLMRPQWGCNVQASLFDPTDSLVRSDVASYTQERVNALTPRAFVRNVDIRVDAAERNIVFVDVWFKASQYTTDQSVSIALETNEVAV